MTDIMQIGIRYDKIYIERQFCKYKQVKNRWAYETKKNKRKYLPYKWWY